MSIPDKPDDARAWRYIERLIDEEDAERVGAAAGADREEVPEPETEWSVEDLWARAEVEARRQEIAREGQAAPSEPAAPKAPPAVNAEPAPSPAPAKVAPVVPIRRKWRIAALLVAACVALVAVFVIVDATEGPDIAVHPPPSGRELAEADRDLAEARCALKDWAGCKERLDEAAELDPAGEGEARVRKAREAIAAGLGGQRERPGP